MNICFNNNEANIQISNINTQPREHDISIISRGGDVIWWSFKEIKYDIEER